MYFNKISISATFSSKVQTGTSIFFLFTIHLEVSLINEGLPYLSAFNIRMVKMLHIQYICAIWLGFQRPDPGAIKVRQAHF